MIHPIRIRVRGHDFYLAKSSIGFALPTILIISVVMLMVLSSAMVVASSSANSLDTNHFTGLAKRSAESGLTMAQACLIQNNYQVTWSNSNPLRPNTDCSGQVSSGASQYVLQTPNERTSFSVGVPTNSSGAFIIESPGKLDRIRTSTGTVWRTYTQVARMNIVLPNLVSIDGGYAHSLGLSADKSTIYAWGNGSSGQLGTGTTDRIDVPRPTVTRSDLDGSFIKQVAAGGWFSLALTENGNVYAWGRNDLGQIGDGTNQNRLKPVPVTTAGTAMAGKKIAYISAGDGHSLAIDIDGKAYAWGSNQLGSLGNGTTTDSRLPVAVATSTGALSGGVKLSRIESNSHTPATLGITTDGRAVAWGWNDVGQLGDGTTAQRNIPVFVSTSTGLSGKTIKQVATATGITYFLTTDNLIFATGQNDYGGFADGTYGVHYSSPRQVQTSSTPLAGKTITEISAGGFHAIALTSEGRAYGWGWNDRGQAGLGYTGPETCTTVNSDPSTPPCSRYIRPVAVTGTSLEGKSLISLASGDRWSFGVASDGTAHAWGASDGGMLGINQNTPTVASPQRILFQPQGILY